MGYFFTNFHTPAAPEPVVAALRPLRAVPAFVLPRRNGWTSVYPRPLEGPEAKLLTFTKQLSRALAAFVFAFDCHDSDVFRYVLAYNGAKLDEFVSNPAGYNAGKSRPKGGDASAILPLCVPGTQAAAFEPMFKHARTKPPPTPAERDQRRRDANAIGEARERLRRADPHGWYKAYTEMQIRFLEKYRNVKFHDDGGPETGAEELAAFLAGNLGIDRARAVNGYRAIHHERQHPDQIYRRDEALGDELIVVA